MPSYNISDGWNNPYYEDILNAHYTINIRIREIGIPDVA